jgi:flagellar export protein FliJ
MVPYRFRLSVLLKLREQERDQRRMEHAQALEAERILLGRRHEIVVERRASEGAARQAKSPGIANVDGLQQLQRYLLLLQAQIAGLDKQIEQVKSEVERRRQALVEADRQVQMLEKLREKQLAAHERAALAHEAKEFDELAIGGFNRAAHEEAPR